MLTPCPLQQRGTGQRLGAHDSAWEPTGLLPACAAIKTYVQLADHEHVHDAPAERWSSCHVWMRLRIAKLGKSILTSRLGAQV